EYGGTVENRLRFPLEVFAALRRIWSKPLLVRISAHDWMDDGNTGDDAVVIAQAFKTAGADLIDVSSGQTHPNAKPVYGRMYQTPFADRIRNEVGIPVMAVGNITSADQGNTIIAAGRADLCALGRPHLADPYWTLRAAAQLGYASQDWPPSYQPGAQQLQRLLHPEDAR
ncbi:MAG TPA: bifunctional salicylyl-CoA 5-hydroxylase/oxidoreductase, partial [Rhodocyclaceae bacterium]|nr:bifunctional salicylyl-CoA 5-hydroxylase/oxidoreductase [Rhodocyclaceae bacterium]